MSSPVYTCEKCGGTIVDAAWEKDREAKHNGEHEASKVSVPMSLLPPRCDECGANLLIGHFRVYESGGDHFVRVCESCWQKRQAELAANAKAEDKDTDMMNGTWAETEGGRHYDALARYREAYRTARNMRRDARSTLHDARGAEDDLEVARYEFVLAEAALMRASHEMLRRLVGQEAMKLRNAHAAPK